MEVHNVKNKYMFDRVHFGLHISVCIKNAKMLTIILFRELATE